MRNLDRFLDDNNIIKREEVLASTGNDFDVRTAQFLDMPEPEPKPAPPPQEKPKPKKRAAKKVTKTKAEIKSRRDMIVEMMEKTQYQLLAKEVDYEVYQIIKQQHSENMKEREICDQNIKSIKKDAKLLERRIDVLQKFLDKESQNG